MATDEQVTSEEYIVRQGIDDPDSTVSDDTQELPEVYSSEHLLRGFWTQHAQDISYFTDEGVCVVMVAAAPNATNPDGSEIKHERVRYGKSITKMVVTGTAERKGAWPAVPHWDVKNPDIICESHRIQVANPHQITEDAQIYRVAWEFCYRFLKPVTDQSQLPAGTTPLELETSDQHYFDSTVGLDSKLNDMNWMQL